MIQGHQVSDIASSVELLMAQSNATISTMKKGYNQNSSGIFSLAELSSVGLLSLDTNKNGQSMLLAPVRSDSIGPSEFKQKLGDIIRNGLLDIEDDDLSLFSSSFEDSFSGDTFAGFAPKEIIIPARREFVPTEVKGAISSHSQHGEHKLVDKEWSRFSSNCSVTSTVAPRKPRRTSSDDGDFIYAAMINDKIHTNKKDPKTSPYSPRKPCRSKSFDMDEHCIHDAFSPRKPRRSQSPFSR
jgi:hypothetical protein